MPDGVQHSAHLAVSSLAEGKLDDPRTAFLTAPYKLCLSGCRNFTIADRQALGKGLDCFFGRLALDCRLVQLAQTLAWMGDAVDKVTVVREKDQSFRVGIQSSCGNQTDAWYPDQVRDFLFRMSVRNRRNIADRLVKCNIIAPCSGRVYLTLIDRDPLCIGICHRAGRGDDFAIHHNPTGGDNLLGATARRDSGGGDYFLQPLWLLRRIFGWFHIEMLPEEERMRRKIGPRACQ